MSNFVLLQIRIIIFPSFAASSNPLNRLISVKTKRMIILGHNLLRRFRYGSYILYYTRYCRGKIQDEVRKNGKLLFLDKLTWINKFQNYLLFQIYYLTSKRTKDKCKSTNSRYASKNNIRIWNTSQSTYSACFFINTVGQKTTEFVNRLDKYIK